MATQPMLRDYNIPIREGKMQVKRLTLLGAFDSLRNECAGASQRKLGVWRDGLKALRWSWVGVLMLGAGLAGCAEISVTSAPEAKTKYVAQRAEARWQLLI